MPAPGTKKFDIEGRPAYLPAEDVELERLISLGVAAQARYDLAKAELDEIKAKVVEIAQRRRRDERTVTLTSIARAGAVQVTFPVEFKVNATLAAELEKRLPAHLRDAIYSKKTEYSLARSYHSFMKQPQGREMEQLKVEVAKTFEVRAKSPSVKFLAPSEPPPREHDDA